MRGSHLYNYLQVKEADRSVILSTNVLFGVQSVMMKEDGLTGMYYDYALAAPVMAETEKGNPLPGSWSWATGPGPLPASALATSPIARWRRGDRREDHRSCP